MEDQVDTFRSYNVYCVNVGSCEEVYMDLAMFIFEDNHQPPGTLNTGRILGFIWFNNARYPTPKKRLVNNHRILSINCCALLHDVHRTVTPLTTSV